MPVTGDEKNVMVATGSSRMRMLIIAASLTAITALAHTASATVITYTLNNVDMNSLTTGLGVFAGTLSGDFAVNGTTLVSADITASTATVSGHSFPGFEYTYGIASANSTLTNGLGQAEPNFRLDSGSNELELAWPTADVSTTGISGFDANHSFESEQAGGNRFVTSGGALDPVPVPSPGPVASLVLLALGVFLLAPRAQAVRKPR
jgi:hypothetical protein